ncbi:MAG: hypothetical protein RMA76_14250 [Deltaproteobacteria bacterium]|jgi:hypothetical protein
MQLALVVALFAAQAAPPPAPAVPGQTVGVALKVAKSQASMTEAAIEDRFILALSSELERPERSTAGWKLIGVYDLEDAVRMQLAQSTVECEGTDDTCAAELFGAFGSPDFMITGRLDPLGERLSLGIKVYRAESFDVLFRDVRDVAPEAEEVLAAVQEIAGGVAEHLAPIAIAENEGLPLGFWVSSGVAVTAAATGTALGAMTISRASNTDPSVDPGPTAVGANVSWAVVGGAAASAALFLLLD